MFSQVSVCPQGGLCQGTPPPRTETPLDREPPWIDTSPGQIPPWTENPPRQRPPSPRTVTCGRYASYLNACLFYEVLKQNRESYIFFRTNQQKANAKVYSKTQYDFRANKCNSFILFGKEKRTVRIV